MKTKIIAIILVFAGYIAVTEALERYSAPKEEADFARFYGSAISGRIIKLRRGKVDVIFSVTSKPDQSFRVYPVNSGGLGSFRTTFSWLAAVSDSVQKQAMSDSLILYKKNAAYRFAFKRPE